MKDLDLTGIGNALVDLQYEVTEAELAEMEFGKGTMTLVDLEKQGELTAKFEKRFKNKMSGGSAANTIIAFARTGGKAAYITRLGKDDLGDHYQKEFNYLGIELGAEKVADSLTGTCFVMITPDAERTLVTSLGANTSFNKDHIDEELIKRSKWFYIEGYKFSEETGAESINYAIELCKKYDTKIAVTFSDTFIIELFRDNLENTVKNADLIFCNNNEAKAYTKKETTEEAFEELAKTVPGVAYTNSEKGSIVFWEGKRYNIDPYPVKAIDATGAGDSYAGGFLYGIIKEEDPLLAGKLGSYIAAETVAHLGPRLLQDHRLMLEKIKAEM